MTADAKGRMVEATALLVRERGVEGTSFADVLAASGAPRGSIYHHFPGGKAQLVEAATRYAGNVIADDLTEALRNDDPISGLRRFAATWRSVLRESDFLAGCAIVAAAVEGDANPAARRAAAVAFGNWEEKLAGCFIRCGLTLKRSRTLATLVVAAMEGAIVVSRAQGTTQPLERVVSELEEMISSALAS